MDELSSEQLPEQIQKELRQGLFDLFLSALLPYAAYLE